MGLLTDFYNTVARFFRPQEDIIDGDNSKSVATNRLKLVLMQDRTNLTPKILEQMRGELIDLLSKYLEMDKDLLELNFEQEGDQVALMLSIPVIRAKDEDEIEEALKSQSIEDNSEDEIDSGNEDNSDDNSDADDEITDSSENDESSETDSGDEIVSESEQAENNETLKEESEESINV